MTTLHTFGCSITQGFALDDVVNVICDEQGQPLTPEQIRARDIPWTDIHRYAPSQYAWPQQLADRLGITVVNHARRGACFQQIARQCVAAAPTIQPQDTAIVMWTYLSRISLQWPARTTVPFCNIVDSNLGYRTRRLPGFNRFFGLERSTTQTAQQDQQTHQYIQDCATAYLDPRGVYNHYYNNLVLLHTVDGLLRSTGARVIHLSVEHEPYTVQLESARQQLDPSLREPYVIPDPKEWYRVRVDHQSCVVIHDPRIPPAKNDQHPSELHHSRFADHLYQQYFS